MNDLNNVRIIFCRNVDIIIKCFIFLKIFILFFYINIYIKRISNLDIKEESKPLFPSRDEAFKNALPFLNKTLQGLYINDKNSFRISNTPRISSIIPVYNCKNTILRAIRSIQNQNFLDLEIILVNDFSTDDSLLYIQELQKEDPRIKIINNKKNMGILYSRSIGALSSKGKYIFPLDDDDMFLDKDVFSTILNKANEGNYDIVEFKGIFGFNTKNEILERVIYDTDFGNHELNLKLKQPELGRFPIIPGTKLTKFCFVSIFIWAKCIKSKI